MATKLTPDERALRVALHRAAQLPVNDARKALRELISHLWAEGPETEWNSGTWDGVVQVLERRGLVPEWQA